MQLLKQELQYFLNAIDTHVVAALGIVLAQKVQIAFNELPPDPNENTGAE